MFPVPKSISPNLEDHAIPRFYHDWVDAVAQPGYLNFVRIMSREDLAAPCFTEVFAATAYANLANQTRNGSLAMKARQHYGNSLILMNQSLQEEKTAVKDSVLATIILAGLYEVSLTKSEHRASAITDG
jgi:hypothetical protein